MKKRRMKLALDVALTLLLGCQMAYALVGEASHEITGLCMLALLALHHALNGGFHRRLFKGRYTPYRAALTAIDAAMLAIFLAQGLSGLMMAKHVRVLSGASGAGWARKVHLLGAYWGFALCGVHAGMHMTGLLRKGLSTRRWVPLGAALAAAGYGAYAFIARGLPAYMTLRQQFVFFDYGEPLARFFLDYAAMLALFMALGGALGCALQSLKGRVHP